MKVIRESIFKIFDGLSDTLDNTSVYIRHYSRNASLRQKAEGLYTAMLNAMKGIISWLRKNPLSGSKEKILYDPADQLQRSPSKPSFSKMNMGRNWRRR